RRTVSAATVWAALGRRPASRPSGRPAGGVAAPARAKAGGSGDGPGTGHAARLPDRSRRPWRDPPLARPVLGPGTHRVSGRVRGETGADVMTTIAISPAPVRRSVKVNAAPQKAFQVFTSGMGKWWPTQ